VLLFQSLHEAVTFSSQCKLRCRITVMDP
jgi:hypothetical protein